MCCRLNEIRVLKVRLADMRRELHVLRTGVANVDVLKREVRDLWLDGMTAFTAAHRTTPLGCALWGRGLHAFTLKQADCLSQRMMGVCVCVRVCAGGQPGPSAAAGAHKGQGTQ